MDNTINPGVGRGMMPMAPADRARLARVLGMLGSPHQGERDAAALAADRLVRGRGLEWADVLAADVSGSTNVQAETPRRRDAKPPAPEWAGPPPSNYWTDLKTCADSPGMLTPWERNYVASIWHTPRPSPKQKRILADIATRLRSAGSRTA